MYFLLCDLGDGLQIIDSFEDKNEGPYLLAEYSLAYNELIEMVTEKELTEMRQELTEMRQDLEYKIDLLTDD